MYLIIEEYQYRTEAAKRLLREVFPWEQEGAMGLDYVGYHYSHALGDTVFFLPKVVVDRRGLLFGKQGYDPEALLNLTRAKEEGLVSDDDYEFIYGFSVWIYRAISEYRKEQERKPQDEKSRIIYNRDIATVGTDGDSVSNTFLDIMLSLIRFNQDHQDYLTFIVRDAHSGYNKINWPRTIHRKQPMVRGGDVMYADVVSKKREVNYEEELLVIYLSILRHLSRKYGFPVDINMGYELMDDDEFDNYLDGYGTLRLEQIRYKYFADKQVLLWQLCYDFFDRATHVNMADQQDDYLVVKNFNIVFEAMIDRLLSDKDDARIANLHLKEQADGKRVDHIYAYQGLIHNQGDIYYIGDSKYYKQGNTPAREAVYKQYTYARNVIQANLDLFNNREGHYEAGKDYLIYRDKDTEGYNITPNFFISARIDDNKDYRRDGLTSGESVKPNYHFPNRLFDRDTLLLRHYNINFLYVLSVYGSDNEMERQAFRQKARRMFREEIIREIEEHYQFFSLQLKPTAARPTDDNDEEESPTDSDKMRLLIERKYFHQLLGKAFRPFREEEFLYLSLEKSEEYYDENMRLLSTLSRDFYIRHYKLGSDPRDTINTFAQLTYHPEDAGGDTRRQAKPYAYRDMRDEVLLVGGYRADKHHMEWIREHGMYNIRINPRRAGYRSGIIDSNVVSARYLVLYQIGDHNKRDYHVYSIESWATHSQQWMERHGYENPNGSYMVYKLGAEVAFEPAVVNAMIGLGVYKELEYRKEAQGGALGEWRDDDLYGAPVFLTGQEIADYALASHRQGDKALVAVNIQDHDLSRMGSGYSVGTYVARATAETIRAFTEVKWVVYSNKQRHRVYRVQGDVSITAQPPEGYLSRKYSNVIKETYPNQKDREKLSPEFYLNFPLVADDSLPAIDQRVINKVPEGLSGYDTRVIEI